MLTNHFARLPSTPTTNIGTVAARNNAQQRGIYPDVTVIAGIQRQLAADATDIEPCAGNMETVKTEPSELQTPYHDVCCNE